MGCFSALNGKMCCDFKEQTVEHGGDIGDAARRYGIDPADWLDLSTGINPRAYDTGPIPAASLQRLPEPGELKALLGAARAAYRVPDHAHVTAAPGTQALIQLLARSRRSSRVAVVGPTYSEHAIAWRSCGHEVVEIGEPDAGDADVVVAVNPNNPDGRRIVPDRLAEMARDLAARDGILIVDEAFADAHPEISLAPRTGMPGLVVLRSFGKFFGLAGVRLGFAGHVPGAGRKPDTRTRSLGRLRSGHPYWQPGARRRWMAAEYAYLAGEDEQDAGCPSGPHTGSTSSAGPPSSGWPHRLRRTACKTVLRLMVSGFGNFPIPPIGLRFGLPGTDEEFRRLDAALSDTLSLTQLPKGPHAALG